MSHPMSRGWEATVVRDLDPLNYGLYLYRRAGEETECITALKSDWSQNIERVPVDTRISRIHLPEQIIHPLRDALIEATGGPASTKELKMLYEAVATEQARVDMVLEALLASKRG